MSNLRKIIIYWDKLKLCYTEVRFNKVISSSIPGYKATALFGMVVYDDFKENELGARNKLINKMYENAKEQLSVLTDMTKQLQCGTTKLEQDKAYL